MKMAVEISPRSVARGAAVGPNPAGSHSPSPTTAKLIALLNHPMRRAILRFLLKVPAASSTETHQAIAIFGATTNLVNFHLDILVKGTAASREAVAGRQYVYSVTESVRRDWIEAVLLLTDEED